MSARRPIHHNPLATTYLAPPTKDNSSQIKSFYQTLPSYSPTPLISLPTLAAQIGVKNILIKSEISRLTLPSFKLLGTSWAIRKAIIHSCNLSPLASLDELKVAVQANEIKFCAATDGNHGRAVAFMGRLLGVTETKVFVPGALDVGIVEGIETEGEGKDGSVAVERVDGDYDETVRMAHRFGEEGQGEGWMLIEAVAYEGYVDVPAWAVEGYTTMFHEIDAQISESPTMIIAPLGVGSLTQAIVTHYKSPNPRKTVPPKIVTTEPDTAATLYKSLKAGQSVSITTSSTIMAGLECGTVSSIAWPLLREGVDISATVSDWECHEAILYLKEHGIEAGPCGATSLAGLRRMAAEGMLGRDDVVVCICTEGARPYDIPRKILESGQGLENVLLELQSRKQVQSYMAQWLEYHDIDVKFVHPGTKDTSLLGISPGFDGEKRILLVFSLNETESDKSFAVLAASLDALSRLKHASTIRNGDIAFAMISSVAGLRSVLRTWGKVEKAILLTGREESTEMTACCEEADVFVRSLVDLGTSVPYIDKEGISTALFG